MGSIGGLKKIKEEIKMGMDLVPIRGKMETFSFNLSGWGQLEDTLRELGAKTSVMAGMNDGALIPIKTLRDWGMRLEAEYGIHSKTCKMEECGGTQSGFMGWPGGFEGKLRCFAAWCKKVPGCRQY